MDSTGARRSLQMPSGVLRPLVGAMPLAGAMIVLAFIAVLAGTNGLTAGKAHAGVISKITVNSTGNTDDGDCEGPANDNTIGGDCTLIEAINDANDGLANVINFQPSVFTVAARGHISIRALAFGGKSCPTLAGLPTRTPSGYGGVLRIGLSISCR
jgi:hypothetical protein